MLTATPMRFRRFMKLRLDRVLRFDLSSMSEEEALKSAGELPEFQKPLADKWTAPYPRYAPGWWKVFYPENRS